MGGSIALTIDSQAAPNKLTQRERVPSVAPPENKKRSMAAPFKGVDEVTIVSSPVEVYQILARSGGRKGSMSILALIISGMMAGMYVGAGAFLFFKITGGMQEIMPNLPGVVRLVGGLVFPWGLVLVIVTGTELFTGNTSTMVIALYEKTTTPWGLVKNWICSYIGNMAGCLLMVLLSWLTKILIPESEMIIKMAETKVHLSFQVAMFRAMGCNWLVAMAIYVATASQSMEGKILGVWGPITAFIALGFEHCVANMYFIPMGMALGADISVAKFIYYCIPVTLGNTFSAVIFVATVFSFLHGSLGKGLIGGKD